MNQSIVQTSIHPNQRQYYYRPTNAPIMTQPQHMSSLQQTNPAFYNGQTNAPYSGYQQPHNVGQSNSQHVPVSISYNSQGCSLQNQYPTHGSIQQQNFEHAVPSRFQQDLSNIRDASFQKQLGSQGASFPDDFGGHFQSQFINHDNVQQQRFEQQLHASPNRYQDQLSNSSDASFQDQLGSQGASFPDEFGSQDIYDQNQFTHHGKIQQPFQPYQQYNTGRRNQLYAYHDDYQQQPSSSQVANNSSQGTFTPIDNS